MLRFTGRDREELRKGYDQTLAGMNELFATIRQTGRVDEPEDAESGLDTDASDASHHHGVVPGAARDGSGTDADDKVRRLRWRNVQSHRYLPDATAAHLPQASTDSEDRMLRRIREHTERMERVRGRSL